VQVWGAVPVVSSDLEVPSSQCPEEFNSPPQEQIHVLILSHKGITQTGKGDAHQAVSGNGASDLEEGEARLDLAGVVHQGQVVAPHVGEGGLEGPLPAREVADPAVGVPLHEGVPAGV
jgi:hypothetical protein